MKIMQPHKVSFITKLILLICLAAGVSSIDTLNQGDSLNSSSQLVSAKRIFTLGFYTPQDTTNTYLAIWYTDDSSNPVWIGNRENPISNSNTDPILTVSTAGQVMITHSGGESIQLYSGEAGNNLSAALLDSGNFVVKDMRNQLLWQSFDYPTDTLLPGMKLGINHRTGRNWILSSWFGRTNPAPGAFTLEWDHVVGRLLIRRRGVVYWSSSHLKNYYDQNLGEVKQFRRMNFNLDAFTWNYNFTNFTSADENYFKYSLIQVPNLTPDDRKVISGWKLEYQGDVTEKGNRPVMVMASLCYSYTTKGPNGYPGCILWGCRTNRETFVLRSGSFKPVNGKPALSVYDNSPSLSESDCREMCWNQCECAGYMQAVGRDGCVYWSGRDLEFVQSLDASANQIYVLQSAPSSKGMKKHVKIILVVVSTVLVLILVVVFFVVRKIKRGKMEEKLHELLRLEGYTENYVLKNEGAKNHDLRLLPYSSIQSATSSFSLHNKLGEGGFGPVYKGKTPEGQDIAVKVLSRQSGQGLLEFKTELVLISKLQHVNLVKLLGFCIHGDDKMIIYEYMPNKSLDFSLFNPSKREQLDWEKRFKIIEGIAQGLLYLHKHSRLRIIHRDMKPSNILLDENMIPKISDFGLARIFKENAKEANTNRRVGTYGYIAPEYAMQGLFSVKSDVYSFGVLVLEIVSGRKNSSFDHTEGPLHLVEYAWELWRKDSAVELMDPTLRASCVLDQLQRCVHIGLLCVENHAADRPTSEDVIMMLKNETTSLPMPKNPSFIAKDIVLEEKEKSRMPQKLSENELSLTEIRGR